ncbi:eukaryotic translation elongation factor 1 epsilon-1 [Diorhabda sublineata]|uniref:eukaryotic translation elongation factor 1 epsilon-1 n=1 Tax=Diorhabda sublineata TaxID=1163346 RepID=UPI0024E17E5F|nr:eukaryotic translation elongation factor 1 epsilon-1 [Diorhabda sublineata]
MVINASTYLKPISTLLKVKLDNTKSKIPTSETTVKIFNLLKKSNSPLGPQNQIEKIQIQQWIEYAQVYGVHVDSSYNAKIVLKELNNILALKTYLVSHRLTIADILFFYMLLRVMETLSNLDKEKYLNVCRWFDNIQNDTLLRDNNKIIDFRSNFLATLVPAKH